LRANLKEFANRQRHFANRRRHSHRLGFRTRVIAGAACVR
jgi:hypothetical protein